VEQFIKEMGIKRLTITFLVIVFVLGLLVALLFQAGADEQIIKTVLPKFEDRFGVDVGYREASASMTGLSLDDVEIKSKKGGEVLAGIKRLTVGVRLGPLFFGDLEVTKVRIEGLDARVGRGAGSAPLADWIGLANKLGKRDKPKERQAVSDRPEIHIVSGSVAFDDGAFLGNLRGIEGRIGPSGRAALTVDGYDLTHGDTRLVQGRGAEIQYSQESGCIEVQIKKPKFELPVSGEEILKIIRDGRASFKPLKNIHVKKKPIESLGEGSDSPDAREGEAKKSLKIIVSEASGTIVDQSETGERVEIDGVTVNIAKSLQGPLTVRAGGQSLGTDARWTLGLDIPPGGDPAIIFEIPDVSLAKLGDILFKSDHVDWERAFADGSLKAKPARDTEEISFSGQISVSGIDVTQERLAPGTVKGLFADSDFKISYDRGEGIVRLERLLVSRGPARATFRGEVRVDRLAFDLYVNVPPTACSQVLNAVPEELRPRLRGVRMEGQISLDLHVAVDEKTPEATVLDANLDNRCKIAELGDVPDPNYFRGPFAYVAYAPDGGDLRLITGPGTDRWASLAFVSPYVIEALLTTEDGKFWHHKGLTIPEIKRAIEINLRKENLTHGASTITMQLAKNLFLTRDRSISRKLQELFFVWYLESNFTKEEILELYLNAVEFGPSVYGIRDASSYYFGRDPLELNAIESVFLVKLLPNPITKHRSYLRGEVSEKMMTILHKVLKIMKDREWITELEYVDALQQKLVFHKEGEPLPEPRPRVSRTETIESLRGEDFESEPDEEEMETEEPEWDGSPAER
jgi:hypothetical protein